MKSSFLVRITTAALVASVCLSCQQNRSGEERESKLSDSDSQPSTKVRLEDRLTSVLFSMRAARTPADEVRGVLPRPPGYLELTGMPPYVDDCAGSPGNSWRYWVFALSRIDYEGAYGIIGTPSFGSPWNAERNADFAKHRPTAFCITQRAKKRGYTNVVTITGEKSIFEIRDPGRWRDAPENLIVLFTVRNMPYHWMQPGDIDQQFIKGQLQRPADKQLLGVIESGIHVGFVDGQVMILSREIPFDVLAPFLSYKDAAKASRGTLLGYAVTTDEGPRSE